MKRISKRSLSIITDKASYYLIPAIILVTFIALLAYIYEINKPVKLADIKVPIATDKASYYPGQKVSGIFFGETYYEGSFRVLREVFCSNYKGIISPPEGNSDNSYYNSQSKYRKLEGQTVVIGYLPPEIPIGSNCVLQFTNQYTIKTLFGERHEEYVYYTQNFAIVTEERRNVLDCEATGKKDCVDEVSSSNNTYVFQTPVQADPPENKPGDIPPAPQAQPQPRYVEPSPAPVAAPVMPPEKCQLNVLGMCVVQ